MLFLTLKVVTCDLSHSDAVMPRESLRHFGTLLRQIVIRVLGNDDSSVLIEWRGRKDVISLLLLLFLLLGSLLS
jgi:hypothetical protein